MNKKIGIALGVIVLAMLVVFFATRSKKGTDESMTKKSVTPVEEQMKASMEQKSISALLAAGASQKCTFSDTLVNSSNEGTVYISSGKMRGDFTATAGGQTHMSHMITADNTSYIWMDGQTSGYKMSAATSSANAGANSQTGVDTNKNYNFKCDGWKTDGAMFALPTAVTFHDFDSLMQQAPPAGGQPKKNNDSMEMMKAACENLQEPAKTQCLAAVK